MPPTATAPAPEETTVKPWRQPPVTIGQRVLYFKFGTRQGCTPTPAFVTKVTPVCVELAYFGGARDLIDAISVRHVDDPYLLENPNWRKWGGWDYLDADKDLWARLDELDSRLASIEDKLQTELDLKTSRNDEIHKLRGQLKLLGGKPNHSWGVERLNEEIAKLQRE